MVNGKNGFTDKCMLPVSGYFELGRMRDVFGGDDGEGECRIHFSEERCLNPYFSIVL